MTKYQQTFYLTFYGLLLSSIIGIISFTFIFIESKISHLLWNYLIGKPFLILLTCLFSGLFLGYLKSMWGDYPKIAHHTIDELKTNQRVSYKHVLKNLMLALFILIFGAGVGPEAALLSSIVMLSVWQADKLRYLSFNQTEFLQLNRITQLKRMVHPTNFLKSYQQDQAPKHPKWKSFKTVINSLFALNGLLAFLFLSKWTEQPSFISKMGTSMWQPQDLLLFLPLLIVGYLAGKSFLLLRKKMVSLFNFWNDKPHKKGLIGSGAIAIVAIFSPGLLFSGQTSLSTVPEKYLQYSVVFLLFLVIVKLVFLEICLHTGWVGGDIFPIVFASIVFGFSISKLFPNFDILFITVVLATTMAATIIGSLIGVAAFIALFFPLNVLPIIILVTICLVSLKKLFQKNQQRVV